ncbi:PAS domain S-box protein [Phaeospirillum tilakii]|uniref:histidine kinase n=1 Tax=Phaeospirillum tilakii TaxID=741673 RepID=A0ABW5CA72_9PROT
MRRLWRTMGGRLLLVALGVEILGLSLVIGNDLRRTEDKLLRQIEDEAVMLGPVLAAALVAPLSQQDTATVHAVLDESRAARGLVYLAVLGPRGEPLAFSGWPEATPLPPPGPPPTRLDLGRDRRYDAARSVAFAGRVLGRVHFGLDLTQVIEARREMLIEDLALATIGLGLSVLLLGGFGLRAARRLDDLTEASQTLASGRTDAPPLPEGDDDLGRLAAAVNRLAEAVRERDEHHARALDESGHKGEARVAILEGKLGRLSLTLRRLRLAQSFANIASWEFDIATRTLHHSERLPALLGVEDTVGRIGYDTFVRVLHPEDRATVRRAFGRAIHERRPYEVEHRVCLPDGSERWLHERGAVVCDREGRPARVLGITQDIHRRKTAEASLRKLSVAVEQSPVGVLITAPDDTIEYANPTLLRHYGYRLDEVLGRTPNLFHGEQADGALFRAMRQQIHAGQSWRGELRNQRKDGSPLWVAASITPIRDPDGRISHFLCLSEDVGARKAAELEASDSRRRLAEAQRLAGLGSWEYVPATGAMVWSETTYALFGRDQEPFVPTFAAFLGAIHPDDRAAFDETLRRLGEGEGAPEDVPEDVLVRIRRPDGSLRHLQARTHLGCDSPDQPTRMVGTLLDVTEREKANANRDLFRRLVDDAGQAIRIAEPDGRILFVNQAYLTLTGYRRDQIERHPYTEFLGDPASPAALAVAAAYAERRNWTGLLEVARADGTSFTALCNVGVALDQRGRAQFLFSIFSDYSPEIERQRELSDARDAAEAASQAKSAFLANMSHELRTPMNAILGFSQFLEMDATLTASQRDSVLTIYQAGRHLLDLINEILDLARIEAGRIDLSIESVPVEPVLTECLDLIAPLAQERGIALIRRAAEPGLAARADRLRLKQVLVNLLSNAIKYNRPNGTVRILTRRTGPETLRLTVADTGRGIAPDRLQELFIPFNRLGAEYTDTEGTGIGLALSRRIVEAMAGRISVESHPGQGSAFSIELRAEPPDPSRVAALPAAAPLADDRPVTATVLYVDDDPVNLKLLEQVFATMPQLRLVTAPTPGLGLDLARLRRPDLILLDINLPGMDGCEMLGRLRADPQTEAIPVAAVTALAMARDIERGLAAGFNAYLTKPIDIPLLVETVRSLLDAPAPPA